MSGQRGQGLVGHQLLGRKMKAVLEFTYPEDQDKLRHALNGSKAVSALIDIQLTVRSYFKHDADPLMVLALVRDLTNTALNECGEE
jgi:hypothetical protein